MATGYEVDYYRAVARMEQHLKRLADAAQKIAELLDTAVTERSVVEPE